MDGMTGAGDAPGRPGGPDARRSVDRLGPAALERIATGRTGASVAAFFDLDRTIIAGSSSLLMSRTFFREGLLGSTMVVRSVYARLVYQLVGADHDRMERLRTTAMEVTRGWDAAEVRRLARETLEEVVVPLVHAEALELIARHRSRGHDVWIVSSSGEEVVGPIAEHLGVHDVIASRSGIDADGRYDGTVEFYAYGAAKAEAIRDIARVRGYDLGACSAYSDSVTDLPMLSVVGHAVAVNPDRELRAAALALGWETREFRSPVRPRDRLPGVPAPSTPVLVGAAAALVAGAVLWRAWRGSPSEGRARS